MDHEMIERLLALNRRFYTAFADQFANSRSVSDPALTCILPYLPSRARILDVGCGNGRLARLLDRERPGCTYVGVDTIPDLIAEAREQAKDLSKTETTFLLLDVTEPGWMDEVLTPSGGAGGGGRYDCAAALAVLHHIPGMDLRARVLEDMGRILAPEGYLVISTWRFLAHRRMRRKIVDWDAVDIDEERLDPGDYLLDWKRGGRGLRYCHMVDEEELERLAEMSGLAVRETFRAGGREGDLSLFAILDPRA
jgi:SAM-dependent methyltransferase